MEQKLALANCIAIQFYDHKLNNVKEHNDIIYKTLQLITLPELIADGDERSSLSGLKQLIKSIADGDVTFDKKSIEHRLRIICAQDLNLLNSLKATFEDTTEDVSVLNRTIISYIEQLRLYGNNLNIKKLISKASFELNTADVSLRDTVQNLQEELGKYNTTKTSTGEQEGFVQRVTTDDVEEMTKLFDDTKEQLAGASLKTGWHGINRMMGINQGIVPGELWVTPALPHNAKTTFTLSMIVSIALFNDPAPFVAAGTKWEGLTPMILDISLENDLNVNIPIVYKMIYEHFEKTAVDIKSVNSREASKYVIDKIKEKGWHVAFERFNSSEFTIETLRRVVNKYEALGNRIVACRCDYLGVSNKIGLSNGVAGSEIREMYRRARNIASPKKIALISPHQLSPAAKAAKAMDPTKYVRELVGKGFYDGCTTVDNEVDGELFFGITEHNNHSYLEVQRGKHRTIVDTPIKDRYRVLKFGEIGILPWDIDTDTDTSLKSVNSDSVASEEEYLDF